MKLRDVVASLCHFIRGISPIHAKLLRIQSAFFTGATFCVTARYSALPYPHLKLIPLYRAAHTGEQHVVLFVKHHNVRIVPRNQ